MPNWVARGGKIYRLERNHDERGEGDERGGRKEDEKGHFEMKSAEGQEVDGGGVGGSSTHTTTNTTSLPPTVVREVHTQQLIQRVYPLL